MMTDIVKSGVIAAIVFSWAWPACGQEDEPLVNDDQPAVQQGQYAELDRALTNIVALNQGDYNNYLDRNDALLSQLRYTTGGSGEGESPVIIQFSPAKPDAMAIMAEDLAVMARLIDKALNSCLGEPKAEYKMGVQMLFNGKGRSVRAMYLEGMGPLFMVKVNFPLVAPPEVEAKPEPATTSEWEAARKELRGVSGSSTEIGRTSGAEYKEERVELLKKALLTVLRQAVNIRQLKPEDFVSMSAFGSDGVEGVVLDRVAKRLAARASGVDSNEVSKPQAPTALPPGLANRGAATESDLGVYPVRGNQNQTSARSAVPVWRYRGMGRGTVLTIRVRKSDVDAFAKGDLNLETFQSRATINTYAGTGSTAESLDAWLR